MSKKYILDTDICSYILKQKPLSVLEQFKKVGIGNIYISIITYAELIYGAEKTKSQKINRSVIEDFVNLVTILEWDIDAAREYGLIRNKLEITGSLIGNMDLMIAAHVKSKKFILVTNNYKHFSKVDGIDLENWVK